MKYLPDPSRSLRMYSSELSSKASSSAPNVALQTVWSARVSFQAGRILNQQTTSVNISMWNTPTLRTKHLLTSELHVGHNDLLTNASECILVLK